MTQLAIPPSGRWGTQGSGNANGGSGSESGLQARAGYRFVYQGDFFSLFGGAEVGPLLAWQSVGSNTYFAASGVFAPRAGARLHVWGPLWATLDLELGLTALQLDGALKLVPLPAGGVGLALSL